ncbi:hypothetical protein EDD15DRAFT_2583346 [Pisolithus albus]|nr:hypothetical protein EDD15DRAFT_2583346 [Pisolithus albus]
MSRNTDTVTTSPSIPTPSISTGEQTADGVPNEAFEVLIDLLTSDGIEDPPLSAPTASGARVTAEETALRDQSGRLDFEKIRSMFEGRDHGESQGGIPVGAGEPDGRMLDSLGGGTQTDVNDRRDNVCPLYDRFTLYSYRLCYCQQVGDTNISKAKPITSTEQDSRPDRSGYPDVDGTVPSNDVPPPRDVLTTPFSFDQLNDALGSTRDEMRTLRRQYDELQQLTCRDATALPDLRVPATAVRDGTEAGRQITTEGGSDSGPKRVGDDGIAAEVARLSEEEARRALTAGVLPMTNVRPSALLSGDPSSAPFKSSPSTRGNLSPQDISRALDFVERVDEIIWRRSSLPTNSPPNPTFSAGNVEGLLSRLELWERVVRSPSRES